MARRRARPIPKAPASYRSAESRAAWAVVGGLVVIAAGLWWFGARDRPPSVASPRSQLPTVLRTDGSDGPDDGTPPQTPSAPYPCSLRLDVRTISTNPDVLGGVSIFSSHTVAECRQDGFVAGPHAELRRANPELPDWRLAVRFGPAQEGGSTKFNFRGDTYSLADRQGIIKGDLSIVAFRMAMKKPGAPRATIEISGVVDTTAPSRAPASGQPEP